MAGGSELQTGSTLLVLLRDYSQEAWQAFVDRYGPRIYQWCRGFRLQEADAENVSQEVLIKLFHKLQAGRYDPTRGSFRGWLRSVVENTWLDYCRSQKRLGAVGAGGSEAQE